MAWSFLHQLWWYFQQTSKLFLKVEWGRSECVGKFSNRRFCLGHNSLHTPPPKIWFAGYGYNVSLQTTFHSAEQCFAVSRAKLANVPPDKILDEVLTLFFWHFSQRCHIRIHRSMYLCKAVSLACCVFPKLNHIACGIIQSLVWWKQ